MANLGHVTERVIMIVVMLRMMMAMTRNFDRSNSNYNDNICNDSIDIITALPVSKWP